jgi:HD-GYP domain-containing protein (c-di-GMP phosphodiesterase class II)
LKGDAIPLVARLIRITDYFDALTSYRSHRVKSIHSPAEALSVLLENEQRFDLSLFEAFVELINAGRWGGDTLRHRRGVIGGAHRVPGRELKIPPCLSHCPFKNTAVV